MTAPKAVADNMLWGGRFTRELAIQQNTLPLPHYHHYHYLYHQGIRAKNIRNRGP